MSKDCREPEKSGIFIDRSSLDCGDLMPAQTLAHDIETARQRSVAEGAVSFAGEKGTG